MESQLQEACKKGDFERVKNICENFKGKINLCAKDNYCVRATCRFGHLDILKYLCENFIDQIKLDDWDNYCIKYSCEYGHLGIVQYLCENFPNMIDISSLNGHCFARTCSGGNINVIKYLSENHSDKINLNSNDSSCLRSVCGSSQNLEIIKYLCENFESLNLSSKDNYCIRTVCKNSSSKVIRYFLKNFSHRIYLNPFLIKYYTRKVKKCLMEVMGPKVLYVGKDFHIIDVEQYKAFFGSEEELKEDEDHKSFDSGRILVYSRNKKYSEALNEYKITLGKTSVKSARK